MEPWGDEALFLDLDGTLFDIAPTPDEVVVAEGLADLLAAATRQLDGAFAIVTGRPLAEVDRFLAPLVPIAAGVHGAEIRLSPGGTVERKARAVDASIVEAVRRVAREVPGTLVELKTASVALHYRQATSAELRLEAALASIVEQGPDHLILCRGRRVLEIVPRHVSKGTALEALMALPAFKGRRPIMIGDDVSDMSAFAAAMRLGGRGLRVAGGQFALAEAEFSCPDAVRNWLAQQIRGAA